jgi:hypothetical protein
MEPKVRQSTADEERPRKRAKRARKLRYTSTSDWDPSRLEGELRAGGGDEGEPGDPFRDDDGPEMVASVIMNRADRHRRWARARSACRCRSTPGPWFASAQLRRQRSHV